jgi:hypothetical protein
MGQHKYNPTAQLVKEGKLPPKPPKMGKREKERFIKEEMLRYLRKKYPSLPI